jgi:predicted nuclease with RNAse H fold
MNHPLDSKTGIVVGIDVGDPRKGFNAVAFSNGRYLNKYAHSEALAIVAWCLEIGAQVVGIDAPYRWSSTGRARSAERLLAADGIFAFATPSRAVAHSRAFYRWMLNGAELFRLIEPQYPLFNGDIAVSPPVCFETFPQAVACSLAGEIVSAKQKGRIRRELLRKAGLDTSAFSNIDTVDAALCALTAHYFHSGNFKTYGDATDGFIVVPAKSIG